ncbi:MAG: HAD family hydrolase, partial [Actinomycetota bacterium]
PDFFLLEKGLISEAEFYSRMLGRLRDYTGQDIVFPQDPIEVRRMLFGSIRRNDEMIAAAVRIGAHYKTAILTNNVKEWTDWREWVEAHIFDLVVDSSEVGMRKPDPEIYLLTCEKLGVEPARAAFVDDIPTNVEGAAAVGLHAIRFTTTEDVLEQRRPLFPRAFEDEGARA